MITASQLQKFVPQNVKVYSGKEGCCCGCRGKHSSQGPQVTRVLGIVQKNAETATFAENNVSCLVGSRLYIVYPLSEQV